MPYSTQDEVETWGQLGTGLSTLGSRGYDYVNTLQYLIDGADRAIDDYCDVPYGFFEPGGVAIVNEYYNGVDVGDYGLLISFGLSSKRRPFLRLKQSPVLSVEELEKRDSSNNWTTLTEGIASDYLVMEDGVRFVRSVPSYDYKNVRVTYKAGYAQTPGRVNECSARLAANMAHRIIDSAGRMDANSQPMSTTTAAEFRGLAKPVFTPELQRLVRRYRRQPPVTVV